MSHSPEEKKGQKWGGEKGKKTWKAKYLDRQIDNIVNIC